MKPASFRYARAGSLAETTALLAAGPEDTELLADELGLTPDAVTVARGFDSDVGAVVGAAARVRDKLPRVATHRLEAAIADLELGGGAVSVRAVVVRSLPITPEQIGRWLK
ncbi:MAG: hypothetical protein ACREKJ_13985 [Candidatus Rokuibacteriota bacterium]